MQESPLRKPGEREDDLPEHGRPVFVEIAPSPLTKRAAQLGTVAGQAVALLRDIRRRVEKGGGDDRLSRFEAQARARIDDLRHAVSHPEHWRTAAKAKAAKLQNQARARYERARSRTNEVVRERPLHVALAAGVAGFVLGAVARTWRAKRAG